MTVNKDDTVRLLVVALVALVAGGGAGLGSSTLQGGEVTVKLNGPIKAELPPDQLTLLRDQAALAPTVSRLDSTMTAFFSNYREDQAEQRRIYDALLNRLSDLTQRVGINEQQLKAVGGKIDDHTERLRRLERIGPVPWVSD